MGEVVMAAVVSDGRALAFAAPELLKDREVVMAAVASHGYAFLYAAPELKADREVAMAAVVSKGSIVLSNAPRQVHEELVAAASAFGLDIEEYCRGKVLVVQIFASTSSDGNLDVRCISMGGEELARVVFPCKEMRAEKRQNKVHMLVEAIRRKQATALPNFVLPLETRVQTAESLERYFRELWR